ncbi:hypothetical protein ATKI12_1988 [Kitasatospora sp. Ki12]
MVRSGAEWAERAASQQRRGHRRRPRLRLSHSAGHAQRQRACRISPAGPLHWVGVAGFEPTASSSRSRPWKVADQARNANAQVGASVRVGLCRCLAVEIPRSSPGFLQRPEPHARTTTAADRAWAGRQLPFGHYAPTGRRRSGWSGAVRRGADLHLPSCAIDVPEISASALPLPHAGHRARS